MPYLTVYLSVLYSFKKFFLFHFQVFLDYFVEQSLPYWFVAMHRNTCFSAVRGANI